MKTMDLLQTTAFYNYEQYKKIVFQLADDGKSSGEQTEERISATHINAQRIKRIDKQCEIQPNLKEALLNLHSNYEWILLTESWCGDGAQCIPVIAKMVEINPTIKLKLIFRDDHLEIMDQYLTNGSRSIPKLIIQDNTQQKIVATWGSRPKAIQEMVVDYKKNFPEASHDEFVKNLHLWYARDKTQALQEEFKELIGNLA